jgi:hypothetical protein
MTAIEPIHLRIAEPGYEIVPAARMRTLVGADALADWPAFAESWSDLAVDRFMADGGRYRRRRFGCFSVTASAIVRKPHQPHFQGRSYNPLNGGIDRWFEPITDPIATHPITRRILTICRTVFTGSCQEPIPVAWHVEMHQFRIEPDETREGKPTPEGMHRDGVDWVLVALVGRRTVAGGVTAIGDEHQRPLGTFELREPLDAVFLDDRRVWHGVTPLKVSRPGEPAYRDALVVTFRAEPPASGCARFPLSSARSCRRRWGGPTRATQSAGRPGPRALRSRCRSGGGVSQAQGGGALDRGGRSYRPSRRPGPGGRADRRGGGRR